VLALPWALGTQSGRVWLLGRANQVLAPGGLDLASLKFSWFGPTRLTGLVLRDANGDHVIAAPRGTWDRNLWQILFERPRLGTLRLDQAVVDAERLPDGSIDLYETLRPVIGRNPKTALRIEIPDGRLRFRAEGITRPVEADHADVTLEITPVPGPVSWRARLAAGPEGKTPSTLAFDGRSFRGITPPGGGADLEIRVEGRDWPWTLGGDQARAAGRLNGVVEGLRTGSSWQLRGDAALERVEATARWLAGDVLRLDQAKGVWDLDLSRTNWTVRRLELTSPLATFKAESSSRLDGRLDLAALAAQLPHALRLRDGVRLEQGTADVRIERGDGIAKAEGDGVWDLSARVSDLRARDQGRAFTLRDPATLSARLRRGEGTTAVERLTAETPYLKAEAHGDVARGVALTASLDMAGLQKQFRDLVDFGSAELAGRGELTGTYRVEQDRFRSGFKVDLRNVRLSGLGPWKVERDSATVTADIDGSADGSGLPKGWSRVATKLSAGTVSAELTARGDDASLSGRVAAPTKLGDRQALAEGRFEVRRDGNGYRFDSLAVTLSAGDAKTAPPPLRFSAAGRYDGDRGELVLSPPSKKGAKPAAVALGAEGLRVSGLHSGQGPRVDGTFTGDLSALAAWFPTAPEGLRGSWSARATGQGGDDGWQLGVRLDGENVAWGINPGPDATGETLGLAARALWPKGGGRLDLTELSLASRFGTVEAAGRVEDPGGRPVADFKGRISPNWETLSAWLAQHVEPSARVQGRPRAFQVRTPLGDGWRDGFDGEVGVVIDSADVYGMRFGPTAVAVRAKGGKASIDPIETTVNGGDLRLEPEYRPGADGSAPALVLREGSTLTDAEVNDEVSRRVLSFVAPMLNGATRVNGLVSADIEEAVFPLQAGGGKGATVKGEVVFQNVQFTPSGVFRGLLAQIGREDQPLIKIDKPVGLEIADRRVYQRGLVVPIGKLSQVEMDGWVGFDRDLNLTVSVPILPTALADKPLIGGIAANSRVRIPIRGTMDKPEVDQEAFNVGMKELGRSVVEQGLSTGVVDLFKLLNRPRDPNAPPRMTPEQRRERRQEKRAERRMRRGLAP